MYVYVKIKFIHSISYYIQWFYHNFNTLTTQNTENTGFSWESIYSKFTLSLQNIIENSRCNAKVQDLGPNSNQKQIWNQITLKCATFWWNQITVKCDTLWFHTLFNDYNLLPHTQKEKKRKETIHSSNIRCYYQRVKDLIKDEK